MLRSKKFIRCKICGKKLVSVFPTHLKGHGVTLPEYKEKFPGVFYQSEELAERRSRSASKVNRGRILSEETKKKISRSVLESPVKLCGNRHPKWKGGQRVSPGFALAKRELLKSKEFKCEGKDCRENSRYLIIHHEDENYANNDLSNLVILCASCHMKVHGISPDLNTRRLAEEVRKTGKHWLRIRRDMITGRFLKTRIFQIRLKERIRFLSLLKRMA